MKGLRELVLSVAMTAVAVGPASAQYDCVENTRNIVRSIESSKEQKNIYTTDFPANLPEDFFPCFEKRVRIESKGRMEAEYSGTRDGKRYYHIKVE